MPSARSKLVLSLLRSGRGFFSKLGEGMMNVDLPDVEKRVEVTQDGVKGTYLEIGDVPALMLTPADAPADRVILHCHGGGYVSGKLLQARVLAMQITKYTGLKVLTFAYRLAPEHPHPAALEDAMACWAYLLNQGYAPWQIALAGESAGGNLCVTLALQLLAHKEILPSALFLMSPWVDLTQSGESYQRLKNLDATLDGEVLMRSGQDYAGDRPLNDPMISPVFASFQGFPPTMIHVGMEEILLNDSELLHAALLRDGVDSTLVKWAGMCHVFQGFGFPESRASLKGGAVFLRRKLGLSDEWLAEEDGREPV